MENSGNEVPNHGPLLNDPSREAVPTIRGYVYQNARTALAWAELNVGEILYVEGAEDFDRLGRVTESSQVKDYRRNITLRSDSVADVIRNSWITRAANPTRDVRYRLLTTSVATTEQGNPFGKPGIDYWNEIGEAEFSEDSAPAVLTIKDFLLTNLTLPPEMVAFLQGAHAQDIHARVISVLRLDTGLEPTPQVESRLSERLAYVAMLDGVHLPNIGNALNAVLHEVWNKASADGDRSLSLERLRQVLTDSAKVTPRRDLALIDERFDRTSAIATAFAGAIQRPENAGQAATVQPVSTLQDVPPAAPSHLARRTLIQSVANVLNERTVATISGTRYSGKSTLAIDVAHAQDGRWGWVDVREEEAAAILQRALLELRQGPGDYAGVVLDGIPRNDSRLATIIATLLRECNEHGTRILLVADGDLGALMRQRLGIDTIADTEVGPFERAEIAELLRQQNCPPELIEPWTTILEMTTIGDPLFVAARIAKLEGDGFPKPDPEAIFTQPAEVADLRRDARLFAAQELNAAQFELLNRLSVAFDAYSRPVVIAIAGVEPVVSNPGNAIDSLTGAWIREIGRERYSILTIAHNFGEQTHGAAWASRMHEAVVTAILSQRLVTTEEISDALRHCLFAKSGDLMERILLQLTTVDQDVFENFSRSASWLVGAYVGEVEPPDFLSRKTFALLRLTQIRLSMLSPRGLSPRLRATFDEEYPAGSTDAFVRMHRLFTFAEIVGRGHMRGLTLSDIIAYIEEFAVLLSELMPSEVVQGLADMINEQSAQRVKPEDAPLYAFGFLALQHASDIFTFTELLSEVARRGPDFAAAFFGMLTADRQMASGYVIRFWTSYIGDESSDWEVAVPRFIEATRALHALGLHSLADDVAASAVRLTAERSADTNEAVKLAAQLRSELPSDSVATLRRAEARALMLADRYAEAAAIWEDVLPGVSWDGTDFDLYQDYRDAAIACARENRWRDAAQMLTRGASRLDVAALPLWKAAMEFDAAAATWRAGGFRESIASLMNGARILASIDVDQSKERDFMVLKRIGHSVSWMVDPQRQGGHGFEAPPPACASSLDTTRPAGTIDMQPSEVDMILAFAQEYVLQYGDVAAAGEFEARVLTSPHVIARFKGSLVAVFRAASVGTTIGMIDSLDAFDIAATTFTRSHGREPTVERELIKSLFVFGMLVNGVQNRITAELIGQWRTEAEHFGRTADLQGILDQAEGLFVTGTIPTEAAMQNSGDADLQFMASIRSASTLGSEPRLWMRIHALWIFDCARIIGDQMAAGLVYGLMADTWCRLAHERIVLSKPNVTAPALLAAADIDAPPWARLAALAYAAADAANMTMPYELRELFAERAPAAK